MTSQEVFVAWAAEEKTLTRAWAIYLAHQALKSIENDDGSIPTTIWQLRNDSIAAIERLSLGGKE